MNDEVLNKGREAFESTRDVSIASWLVERSCYREEEVQEAFKKFMDGFLLGYNYGLEDGSVLSPS